MKIINALKLKILFATILLFTVSCKNQNETKAIISNNSTEEIEIPNNDKPINNKENVYTLKDLQGTWKRKISDDSEQVIEDTDLIVEIEDSIYKNMHNGINRLGLYLKMIDNCKDQNEVKASKLLLRYQNEKSKRDCYEIIYLDENTIIFDISEAQKNNQRIMTLTRLK